MWWEDKRLSVQRFPVPVLTLRRRSKRKMIIQEEIANLCLFAINVACRMQVYEYPPNPSRRQ